MCTVWEDNGACDNAVVADTCGSDDLDNFDPETCVVIALLPFLVFFFFTLRWSSGVQGWVFLCFRAVLLGLLFTVDADGSFGVCTGWEYNGACGNADVVSTGGSEGLADMCDLEACITLVGSLLCSCCVN